jgi:hypothetical protein
MARTPRTGKKHLKVMEQTAQALELRKAGASLQTIADQLGIKSRQRVHQLINAALKEMNQTCADGAEELRRMSLERLDALQLSLWTQRKNPRVADTLLRLEARRAALMGLDAPQKIAPTTPGGDALPQAVPMEGLPTELLRQIRDHMKGQGD